MRVMQINESGSDVMFEVRENHTKWWTVAKTASGWHVMSSQLNVIKPGSATWKKVVNAVEARLA